MTARRDSSTTGAGLTGLASFRELKGIGPAKESRLHRAGVHTWEALAEVVDALGGARESTGGRLQELSDQISGRVAEAPGSSAPQPADPVRSESFILRISLAGGGRATHSTVTNVRTQVELPIAGWSADQAISFIQEQAGVRQVPAAERAVTAVPQGSSTASAPHEAPAGSEQTSSRDHVLVLDAGKVIGGTRRPVELVVLTAGADGVGELEYHAELGSRSYGQVAQAPWRALAETSGHVLPPERLTLRFAAMDLPPGIQRLRLRLAVRLPAPGPGAPALELGQPGGNTAGGPRR